jgi:hypothetical protein
MHHRQLLVPPRQEASANRRTQGKTTVHTPHICRVEGGFHPEAGGMYVEALRRSQDHCEADKAKS